MSSKKPTVAELQAKIVDLTAALQRERADAENMRRRHHEQMFGLRETVKADVVRDLLPIIDNLNLALKHSPVMLSDSEGSGSSKGEGEDSSSTTQNDKNNAKNDKNTAQNDSNNAQNDKWEDYVKGVQAVVKQFEKTLTDIGVERIKTVGEVFDPHLHEAFHLEDHDAEAGQGQLVEVVCEELQPGFKLGDEVIRHAVVKVKMEKR